MAGFLLIPLVLNGCGGGVALLGLAGLAGKTLVGALTVAAIKSDDIEVTPYSPVIPVGARVPFRVEAFSLLGNKIPVEEYRWEINNPVPTVQGTIVGTINKKTGFFHATAEGQVIVEVTVIGIDGVSEGITLVTVDNSVAPEIATLAAYPSKLTIPVNQSLQFVDLATGLDGLPANVDVAWTVQVDGRQAAPGMIHAQTGVFTALAEGTATVQCQAGDQIAEAEVTVVPAPDQLGELAAIIVNPPSLVIGPNGIQPFVAHGLDANGNFLALTGHTWSTEGDIGVVTSGVLTSGTAAASGAIVAAVGEILGKAQVEVHVEEDGGSG